MSVRVLGDTEVKGIGPWLLVELSISQDSLPSSTQSPLGDNQTSQANHLNPQHLLTLTLFLNLTIALWLMRF